MLQTTRFPRAITYGRQVHLLFNDNLLVKVPSLSWVRRSSFSRILSPMHFYFNLFIVESLPITETLASLPSILLLPPPPMRCAGQPRSLSTDQIPLILHLPIPNIASMSFSPTIALTRPAVGFEFAFTGAARSRSWRNVSSVGFFHADSGSWG